MTTTQPLQRLAALGARLSQSLQPAAPFLTRLVIGHAFVLTGLGKWRNFEGTVAFFTDLGLPAPQANAAFVASLELVGGLLLVLGLGTRLFAALLASTMVVALMTADRADFLGALRLAGAEKGLTDVVPFVFLAFLGWLVAYGAGPLSADRLVFGRGRAAQGA